MGNERAMLRIGRVMDYAYCWHRPGKLTRTTRQCRFCRVAVEMCGCGDDGGGRKAQGDCPACEGSGWVGIVRSKRAATTAALMEPNEYRI